MQVWKGKQMLWEAYVVVDMLIPLVVVENTMQHSLVMRSIFTDMLTLSMYSVYSSVVVLKQVGQ